MQYSGLIRSGVRWRLLGVAEGNPSGEFDGPNRRTWRAAGAYPPSEPRAHNEDWTRSVGSTCKAFARSFTVLIRGVTPPTSILATVARPIPAFSASSCWVIRR